MNSQMHIGHPITSFSARFFGDDDVGTVVIRGYAGNYPMMALHLLPEDAANLAEQINAVLASMNKAEAA